MWTGFSGSNSLIGDSIIAETKLGLIGIGTTTPTSKLTVEGMIETTLGGLKFPDGTVQTTAGIAPTQVLRSLNGLMGDISLQAGANVTITPAGNTITISAAGTLTEVTHDSTLTGIGNAASPLGLAVPLSLTGATNTTLEVGNTSSRGSAVNATGTNIGVLATGSVGIFGSGHSAGVLAKGLDGTAFDGARAVLAIGGGSHDGLGGDGVNATGGDSVNDRGGNGINAVGGISADSGGSGGHGIVAEGGIGTNGATNGLAAFLIGDVRTFSASSGERGDLELAGNLNVSGTKNFKIDHPLDPENKYLYHAAIEASEVLNVYSGNVVTDQSGDAVVTLPDWFEAINRDFRYQLTVVGQFAQAIIASKVQNNRFSIKTSAPNVEVSWQVTGVRSDAALLKHPFKSEEDKPANERGYFLSPDAYGQPEERGIAWATNPQLMRQLKERREEMTHSARVKQQQ